MEPDLAPSSLAASGSIQNSQSVVACQGLGKRFGRTWALAHLDLHIKRGESVLLVGANGSGKTTLLRILCGLLRPNKGTLLVFGSNPREQPFSVRPRVTLVSHRTYLYEQLSAQEHIELWCSLAGRNRQDALQRLDSVGLAARAADPVATFSAGMRKRLSLLRTRIEDPDLVLLDEPFSALDPAGQEMIGHWLEELTAAGKTLIMASHALEKARPLCQRAVVLEQGQITWRGPSSAVTAELLLPIAARNGDSF